MNLPERIKGKRIIVRPFIDDDLPGYLKFMTNREMTKYLTLDPELKTRDGATVLFDVVRQSYGTDQPILALVITTLNDDFIGSCGISSIDETIYECYYILLPEFWGNGLATEAMTILLDYLFENTNLTEIRAYMDPENPKSKGVVERIGMRSCGLDIHPSFKNERLLYAISKNEWQELRAGEESAL